MPKHRVRRGHLNRRELDRFRALLLDRRETIKDEVNGIARSLPQGQKEWEAPLRSADDFIEMAADSIDFEVSMELTQNRMKELNRINDALDRIGDGSFGVCDVCRNLINLKRLQAIPTARLCVDCAWDEEQSSA